ncbi:uracil-DNA glycosylase [Candidatus Methylospira mobilis]|uniref:Type-4 uracil-DNA glycosylase n=2 Tax=Candidatus Methylospira mobilis TaxID=1808979 RepID=A0A5Q0BSU0_9GAMM|nr:uracil-DNA glycosylase [Candidatus Methylospira mobilis]
MGIPVWVPRFQVSDINKVDVLADKAALETVMAEDTGLHLQAGVAAEPVVALPVNSNDTVPLSEAEHLAAEMVESSAGTSAWDDLEARVRACTACGLHGSRTQTVFGVGNHEADWMVIGEAPGEQEDLQGEPFVGRAGQLLTEMLFALGLPRTQVYIANILKCRPPGNRDPQPAEVAACESYLKQQIALVKPRIILAVGRIAAQNLLKTATPIGKLRGSVHRYAETPLVVTYHPAYLLRSPLEKRRAWDDLCLAAKVYREQC